MGRLGAAVLTPDDSQDAHLRHAAHGILAEDVMTPAISVCEWGIFDGRVRLPLIAAGLLAMLRRRV